MLVSILWFGEDSLTRVSSDDEGIEFLSNAFEGTLRRNGPTKR